MPSTSKHAVFVTGDKAIDAMLRDAEPKIQRGAARRALRVTAKGVMWDVQQEIESVTGTYDKSLAVRTARRNNGKPLGRGAIGMAVVSRIETFGGYKRGYAGVLEYGRKPRGRPFPKLPPQGYQPMRKMLYRKKGVYIATFQRELKRELEEMAAKARREAK